MAIQHVQNAVNILFLGILSIQDLKYKQISAFLVYGYLLSGVIFSALFYIENICVLSAVPGVIIIIMSLSGNQKIGKGDGYILVALGIWNGFITAVISFAMGIALSGIVSMIIGFLRIPDREETREDIKIPFVPFILAGYLIGT